MLRWALFFLLVAIIAAILGMPQVAAISGEISKIIFFVFIVLFLLILLFGATIFK